MVPQGVMPPPQLAMVPLTFVPVGSSLVFIIGWPAAGPETPISLKLVMRRLNGEPATGCHFPDFNSISTMPWPIDAMPTSTCCFDTVLPASSSLAMNPGNITCGLGYSRLTQSSPRSELSEPSGSGR